MSIKVVRDIGGTPYIHDFFASVDQYLACDSETMGRDWYRISCLIKDEPSKEKLIDLNRQLKDFNKQALDKYNNNNILATVQFANEAGDALVCLLQDEAVTQAVIACMQSMLAKKVVWVGHNFKFDVHQFRAHLGLSFEGQSIHDTMIAESLLNGSRDGRRFNLLTVQKTYEQIPEEIRKIEVPSVLVNWWDPDIDDEYITYMANDVLVLLPLMNAQKERLQQDSCFRVRKLECQLIPAFERMESVEVMFDKDKLKKFIHRADAFLATQRHAFSIAFGDVNINSPTQMLQAIERIYGVIPMSSKYDNTEKCYVSKPSVDKDALLEAGLIKEPAIECYLRIKHVAKHLQEAKKWYELGLMRISYLQVPIFSSDKDSKDGGARTGRVSSTPQIQNIDEFMKQFIRFPGGRITSTDYNSIELRLMADNANETTLINMFRDGRSPHKEMVSKAFGIPLEDVSKTCPEYRIAKEINFGFLYGMFPKKFSSRVLKATQGEVRISLDDAKEFRKAFFDLYPNIEVYHASVFSFGCINGHVTSKSGRRLYYNPSDRPDLDEQYQPFYDPVSGQWVGSQYGNNHITIKGRVVKTVFCTIVNPEACWRAADWRWRNRCYNMPIQGTGADGIKQAFYELAAKNQCDWETFGLFAMVHDSMDAFHMDESKLQDNLQLIEECMKSGMSKYMTALPAEVEHTVGNCWAKAPSNIREADNGLWIYPDNMNDEELNEWVQNEFQNSITLK